MARGTNAWCGLLLLVFGSAGCGGNPSEGEDSFRVALLLAGPENDEGWNQSAFEGLRRIREELSAETRKITARTRAEIELAMERAAAEGFDLVIGHGVEFNAPACKIADAYPDCSFVTTGGPESRSNVCSLVLRLEEAAYQLGVLAGQLSESGIVSAISGMEFEPVRRVVAGFRHGLLSVAPEAKVLEEYLGSWEDSSLAKETAVAHAERGADVFFQNADAAGVGVFEACRSRSHYAFGCNRDQSPKAPDVILASAVADIPESLLFLASEVKNGTFAGGIRSFGIAEGKVRVGWNEALAGDLSSTVRDKTDAIADQIRRGDIDPATP